MDFRLLSEADKIIFEKEMIEMLIESDKDFVPPLSSRASTLDKGFSGEANSEGVLSYFREMRKQQILAAFDEGEFIGFVSFRENFTSEEIKEKDLPNIYVSTLVLSKKSRGKGVTKKMYSYLFEELYSASNIFTRTWSTNIAHTKILSGFGFSELLRKENDRGEGIDTVYYKREKAI